MASQSLNNFRLRLSGFLVEKVRIYMTIRYFALFTLMQITLLASEPPVEHMLNPPGAHLTMSASLPNDVSSSTFRRVIGSYNVPIAAMKSSFGQTESIQQPSHLDKKELETLPVLSQPREFRDMLKSKSPRIFEHYVKHYPNELKNIVAVYKEKFQNFSKIEHEEIRQLYLAAMQRKIILAGPPGVGKSVLAQVVPEDCSVRYCFISAPSIPNEYKNSGITKLDELFLPYFEQQEPIFIILDEITGLTDRKHGKHNPDSGLVEHLLTLLDRCDRYNHIVVIMTANDLKKLPEQLKSRLCGSIIKMDYPKESHRKEILCLYLEGLNRSISKEALGSIARQSVDFSGRELEHMVRLAASYAIGNTTFIIESAHLERAFKAICDNRVLTSNHSKEYWKSFKKFFPYINSLGGIVLTIIGLYFQWKSHQQQAKFHSEQMIQSAKQLQHSYMMHIAQMVFNLLMNRHAVKEQVYKEAFQLYLRLRGNERADAALALVDFIKFREKAERFKEALPAAQATLNASQEFAGFTKPEEVIGIVEKATEQIIKSAGNNTSILKKALGEDTKEK